MKCCFLSLLFIGAMFAHPPLPSPPLFSPSWEVHISPTPVDGAVNTQQTTPQYWTAYGFNLKAIVSTLWGVRYNRIFGAPDMDLKSSYDFVLVPPRELGEEKRFRLLRTAVEKHFQVQIVKAKRTMQVYVLSAPQGKSPALQEQRADPTPTTLGQIGSMGIGGTDRELSGDGVQMSDLCEIIEGFEHALVVDETNLKGVYSFHIKGNGNGIDHFQSMLEEQLGLVLTRDQREVDVLLIEKR